MKPEDHTSQPVPELSPELEARIVAWVAGEASDFEIAELERILGSNPRAAAFKQEIEAAHRLAREATRPDQAPLRMSAERRAELLRTLGAIQTADTPNSAAKPNTQEASVITPLYPVASKKRPKVNWWLIGSSLAACLVASVTFETVLQERRVGRFNEVRLSDKSVGKGRAYEQTNVVIGKLEEARKKESSAAAPSLSTPSVDSLQTAGDKDLARRDATARMERGRSLSWGAPSRGYIGSSNTDGNLSVSQGPKDITFGVNSAPPPPPNPTEPGTSDEVVALAPFSVKASQDFGYSSPSTAGTGGKWKVTVTDLPKTISAFKPVGLDDGAEPDKSAVDRTGTADDNKSPLRPDASATIIGQSLPSGVVETPVAKAVQAEKQKSSVAKNDAVGERSEVTLSEFSVRSSKPSSPAPESKIRTDAQAISDAAKEDAPLPKPATQPAPFPNTSEVSAGKESVSTFSLHVSDVSFRLAQTALAQGNKPDPESIRPEEFYNAFDYGDPAPAASERIACHIEQSAHPLLQQRNLVRIAMKVPSTGRNASQPLHLTVLLDTSGSMEREDRAATVRRAFEVLVSLLGPSDSVTLIGFARQPHLLAEAVPGNQAKQLVDLIAHTPSEGGTNLEEALKLGGELAKEYLQANAQNRIVLLTDGAANLGDAKPDELAKSIEALRQQSIAFDACGVGLDGIDDSMLESLTRKGDGRYYVLNTPEAADADFARKLAGAFRPAAENVKVQVRFNPSRVATYRLIGFDQHRLKTEDFRNDKVDAAELAADEAANALYQVEVLPQGEGELGEVFVRFRDAATHEMVERSWTLVYEPKAATFDRATPSMQLAGVSALLAEKLRGGPSGDAIKLDDLSPVVNALRGHYANEPRVQALVTLFEQARRIYRE